MKSIIQFLIGLILLIIILNNFGKILTIGSLMVDKVYTMILK